MDLKSYRHLLPASGQDRMLEAKVESLITRVGRAIGLLVCFHDNSNHLTIRPDFKTHRSRFCCKIKRNHEAECINFDSLAAHQALVGLPEGRIQTCPFGATEIAVPVFADGVYAGVLFAGPCWIRHTQAPDASLVIPPTRTWLADRLLLLRSVAREMAALLAGPKAQDQRSERVLHYVREHLTEPLYLAALATHLSLSPSRVRHLVKQLFGVRFSSLVQSMRLQEAARLLRSTDLTVSEIAIRVGIEDPNYLSRIFRRVTGTAPSDYRRRHRTSP